MRSSNAREERDKNVFVHIAAGENFCGVVKTKEKDIRQRRRGKRKKLTRRRESSVFFFVAGL